MNTARPPAAARPDDRPPDGGGAALAAPCVRCGTTGGGPNHSGRPPRRRGLCSRCYLRAWATGAHLQWAKVKRAANLEVCANCHRQFRAFPSLHRRFCSVACRTASRRAIAVAKTAQARVCRGCGTAFHRAIGITERQWARRDFCSSSCRERFCFAPHPTPPALIVTPAMLGIRPGEPAITMQTGIMDALCARYDAPRWTTAAWFHRPRDPQSARYYDAETATQAAA